MTFLEQLNWRFAAKDFDPARPVTDGKIQKILEAIRLTPTAYGLQPYHVYVVTDPAQKEALQAAAYDQPQVSNGSHFLVFCSRRDALERVEAYGELVSQGNAEKLEKLQGYLNVIRGDFERKSAEATEEWAARQAYIALGFAMAACAELEVDSCPMEGFRPAKVAEILGIPAHMTPVVCLAVGRRAHEPKRAKVRFGEEDLFTFPAPK